MVNGPYSLREQFDCELIVNLMSARIELKIASKTKF